MRRWPVHEMVVGVLLAGVLGAAACLEPGFVSLSTQLELSTHATEVALLALPMTLIIIGGGIDLSVGSAMALASVVMGMLFRAGVPVWGAAGVAVVVGAAAGALNGVFVAFVRVHPLIVTLASLAAYRGLAEGVSKAAPISGFPAGFEEVGSGTVLGIPILLVVVLVGAVVFGFAGWRSVAGFRVYAIGDNERGARYCGVPVNRMKLWLYTMSGAMAGIAAVSFAARRDTAKADVGMGIELEVITAVVLGGTSIFGGKGSIAGTLLGVALIHEVHEFASWHRWPDELILIVVGGILIGSVLLNNLAAKRAR